MNVSQWPEKTNKFFKEVKVEMQKVSWPSREEVVNSTILVLVITFILSVFIFGVDSVYSLITQLLF